MTSDHDNSTDQRESYGKPTRDRLDWISKYLELADKVIENHAPDLVKDNRKF